MKVAIQLKRESRTTTLSTLDLLQRIVLIKIAIK